MRPRRLPATDRETNRAYPMAKILVVLVEDNRLLREGLTAMLNEQPDIQVVAAFGNGREAVLKAMQELKPQIILLDLGLKGQNSLRLVEWVRKESPDHAKMTRLRDCTTIAMSRIFMPA
jgi:DNA-binding NarL/FixJ family response regulator